ncbi:hypothetical protein [Paeniglutamicibacter psychrophenolicus]|uniref:hypothetical protein n=1 Tax=Paeniglutamicibacter psychrophenolicus TaxID=257454 RepID=UPI001AE55B7B|nr:hypothetical protein [Paeniglutamicibacter psychrophenolicus]
MANAKPHKKKMPKMELRHAVFFGSRPASTGASDLLGNGSLSTLKRWIVAVGVDRFKHALVDTFIIRPE